jgi:hypothetical protein
MNATACQFCRTAAPSLRQTPTLLGPYLLCRRCRDLYRTAVIDAAAEFYRLQQTSPASAGNAPREAA